MKKIAEMNEQELKEAIVHLEATATYGWQIFDKLPDSEPADRAVRDALYENLEIMKKVVFRLEKALTRTHPAKIALTTVVTELSKFELSEFDTAVVSQGKELADEL